MDSHRKYIEGLDIYVIKTFHYFFPDRVKR